MAALIVELDPLFLGGFALAAEVFAERLEKVGIADNDPYRFVRALYGRPFSDALAATLPAGVDGAHTERRLAATYTALLQLNAKGALAALKSFLQPLIKQGVRLAFVTHLRASIIEELLGDLVEEPIVVFDPAPLSVGLAPETLQAAIVALGLPVRHCYGLLACGASVRAAVRVGLRAAVVPDPIVAFEDCAGADMVGEELNKRFLTKLREKLAD